MTKYTGAALRIIDYRPQASDVTPDRLSAGLGKLQKDNMTTLDRRKLMAGLGALAAGLSPAKSAHAQGAGQGEQQPDRRRFGFNEVATSVWRLLDKPRSFDQLRDALLVEYDVPIDRCTLELHELLDELTAKKLVKSTGPEAA